jgi:hypothetical protein
VKVHIFTGKFSTNCRSIEGELNADPCGSASQKPVNSRSNFYFLINAQHLMFSSKTSQRTGNENRVKRSYGRSFKLTKAR